MTFSEIAMRMLGDKVLSVEQRMCPDQYVGQINEFDQSQSDFPVRRAAELRPEGIECVLMIIESPHVREFDGDPGPAKGATGRMIRKWAVGVIGPEVTNKGVLLINAIQHQCSLGVPTKSFRDDVFLAVWSNGGEQRFMERLTQLYRDGDTVVNCCTKGNTRGRELRQLVQKAISRAAIDVVPMRRTHPAAWRSTRNREHEWRVLP